MSTNSASGVSSSKALNKSISSSEATGGAGRPSRWIALIVPSLAQLMVILDSTIVNIALPTAQLDLGLSSDDRQWVVTGYALTFGSLLLLGGRLSDLFGRIAQGAFAALLAPAALSMVSVTFADNAADRGRAFGVFGAVSGAGGALGLLLGGVLTQSVSWRWCLLVNLVIAVIALFGAFVWLRDSARPERVRLDIAGSVTIILGLVGIVYGLGDAASKGWVDSVTLGSVIGGVVLVAVFARIERRAAHPCCPSGSS
jgi:MFS family permease